jgi:hypothetical protein
MTKCTLLAWLDGFGRTKYPPDPSPTNHSLITKTSESPMDMSVPVGIGVAGVHHHH